VEEGGRKDRTGQDKNGKHGRKGDRLDGNALGEVEEDADQRVDNSAKDDFWMISRDMHMCIYIWYGVM
jgi:hypothetical protein